MPYPFDPSVRSRSLRFRWVGAVLLASALGVPHASQADRDPASHADDSLQRELARKQAVDTELSGLGVRRADAQADLHAHTRALYRLSRGGLLPLAGGIEALLSHASNVDRLERLVRADLERLQALKQRGAALRGQTAQLAAKISAYETSLRELDRARAEQVQEQRAAAGFEQAFETSQPITGQVLRTAAGTLSILGDEPTAARFGEQRGTLALPVSGPSQVREASRAESDGSGLELVSRRGATVRASAAGRVVFADRYASYGRIVILDHGQRYYSVYAGLGDIDVRVGDDLSRSARLASVGESGVLYFEVRKGTRNLPARTWLGL